MWNLQTVDFTFEQIYFRPPTHISQKPTAPDDEGYMYNKYVYEISANDSTPVEVEALAEILHMYVYFYMYVSSSCAVGIFYAFFQGRPPVEMRSSVHSASAKAAGADAPRAH